jgi:4-hydroxy-tetrahydrodipicolinate synthase
MARFGQVITAMVTPFKNDGSLDLDGARNLAKWLEANGNDGLVIAGTTGEAPVLTDDERLSLFVAVIESVSIPVIAGTGTNDTLHSIHMTKEATKLGAAGILVVCPYYNRPPQSGIEAHVRAVADSTGLPIVVYDIPVRSGRKINTPTLLKLAHEGCRGESGRDGERHQSGPRGVRGVQRRRWAHAAVAGGGRGRCHRSGDALVGRRSSGDVRQVERR